MQSRDSVAVGLIVGLTCGACAFLYVIVMESIVLPNVAPPEKPYGAPAMLAVIYCAALGAAGAFACVTKRSNYRLTALAVLLLIAYQLMTGLLWTHSTNWDSSVLLIYPLPLSIFVADLLLLAYLHGKRTRSTAGRTPQPPKS